jgi:hypothetical protein
MHSGQAEAREIDRFAARELFADLCDPLIGKIRAEPVESGHGFLCQPAHSAKSGGTKPRISRSNSVVWFQSANLVENPGAVTHQSHMAAANTPFRTTELAP